jgi:hypothetical protein
MAPDRLNKKSDAVLALQPLGMKNRTTYFRVLMFFLLFSIKDV